MMFILVLLVSSDSTLIPNKVPTYQVFSFWDERHNRVCPQKTQESRFDSTLNFQCSHIGRLKIKQTLKSPCQKSTVTAGKEFKKKILFSIKNILNSDTRLERKVPILSFWVYNANTYELLNMI